MLSLLPVLLTASGGEWNSRHVPNECTTDVKRLERAVISRRLTLTDWIAFRNVAKIRVKKGLDGLPGLIGCADLTNAAAELRSDPATRSLLRQGRISARDYIEIGWALLVAYDPETFPTPASPVVTANIAFVAEHRSDIESLLHDR